MDFLLQKNNGESPAIKIDLDTEEILINSISIPALSKYKRISESHACLSKLNNSWFIEDVGSEHGTFVDSSKVGKMPKELKYWDIIGLGSKLFINEAFICILCPYYAATSSTMTFPHNNVRKYSLSAQKYNNLEPMNCAKEPVVLVERLKLDWFQNPPDVKIINYSKQDHYASSENETIPYVPVHNSDSKTVLSGSDSSSPVSWKPKRSKRYFIQNREPADSNWKINAYFESMDDICNAVAEYPKDSMVSGNESTSLQNTHDSDTQSKSSIESMNIIMYPSQSVLAEIERIKKEKCQALKVKKQMHEEKAQNTRSLSKRKASVKRNKVDPDFSKTLGVKLKQKVIQSAPKSKLYSNKRKRSLPVIEKESDVTQTRVKATVSKKCKAGFSNKELSSKKKEVTFQVNLQQPNKSGGKTSKKSQNITNSNRCRKKASHLEKGKKGSVMRKSENYECHLKSLKTDVKTSTGEQSCVQYKKIEQATVTSAELQKQTDLLKLYSTQDAPPMTDLKKKNPESDITMVDKGLQSKSVVYSLSSNEIAETCMNNTENNKQSPEHKHFSVQYTPSVTHFIKSNLPDAESVITVVDKDPQSRSMFYSSSSNEIKTRVDMIEDNKPEVDNNKSMVASFNKESENYCFKFISRIVEMNTKWLKEREYYKVQNKEPPEVSKGAALLPASFDSYNTYASSFFPMIILEVWEEICKKSKPVLINKNERKFYFVIFSCSKKSRLLKLQCESVVNATSYVPLKNNLVTLNLKLSSGVQCSVFGFITKHEYLELNRNLLSTVEWNNLPSNWVTNPKLIKFDIYVKAREAAPLLKTLMEGNGLCSLEHKIKLVDALDNLKFSPLLNDMLVPNWNAFSVACSGKVTSNDYIDIRESVTKAVCKAMLLPPPENKIILLQGPPGSGKTDIIIHILESLVHDHMDKKKILVTAPSNVAVDEIGNQLIELNERSGWRDVALKFIRVGSLWNIHENLKPYALAERLELRRQNAETERIRREHEYSDVQNEFFSRGGIVDEKCELKYQYFQKKNSEKWDPLLQITAILQDADVILSTLEDCVQLNRIKDSLNLSCCIVDEINQTTEFEILLPLALGINKFFITGDTMQLPAIVESHLAIKCGFQRSVLERFHTYFMSNFRKSPLIIFTEQFRMNASVWYFPLKYIYHKDMPSFKDFRQRSLHFPLNPYIVLDDKIKCHSYSAEYDHTGLAPVIKICAYVLEKCHLTSVGIIVPSNEAKERYSSVLSKHFNCSKIEVDTVYGFQGQEKPVIILTCFQDEIYGRQNYFSCIRKLNVALTRASRSLILCGPFNNLKTLPEIDRLISDAVTRGCYFSYNSISGLSSILEQHLSKKV